MFMIWEDIKAWRRKETRIKGAVRGRVYEKKDGTPSGGAHSAKATPKVELTGMRVIRKDGTIEEIL